MAPGKRAAFKDLERGFRRVKRALGGSKIAGKKPKTAGLKVFREIAFDMNFESLQSRESHNQR